MLEKVATWYRNTRNKTIRFMLALIVAYVFFFVCIYFSLPIEFLMLAVFCSLLIPFMLVVMILTDNPVYEKIKSIQWSNIAIITILSIYIAFSYIWASSEVNSIFGISPGNLPWSITILTVIYFFKNVVLVGAAAAFFFILLYSNIWVIRVFITNYKSLNQFIKSVMSGIVLVLGVGLLIGSSGAITAKKEQFAKRVALFADFNAAHRCVGEIFENSTGVLFLSTGSVLVAKPFYNGSEIDWSFSETACKAKI